MWDKNHLLLSSFNIRKNKQNQELPQADKEQENEILKLRHQVEEG